MALVAASITRADFAHLEREVVSVIEAGADWLHLDVADGNFVPNITYGPLVVEAVRRVRDKINLGVPLDVHLMIQNPHRYVSQFVEAGADWLVVHAEAGGDIKRALLKTRAFGIYPAIAVCPGTPIAAVAAYAGLVNMVTVMSVMPGFAGQRFLPEVLPKCAEVRRFFGSDVLVQVDGGIRPGNAPQARAAGAQVLVSATAIFQADDRSAIIQALKGLAPEEKAPAVCLAPPSSAAPSPSSPGPPPELEHLKEVPENHRRQPTLRERLAESARYLTSPSTFRPLEAPKKESRAAPPTRRASPRKEREKSRREGEKESAEKRQEAPESPAPLGGADAEGSAEQP